MSSASLFELLKFNERLFGVLLCFFWCSDFFYLSYSLWFWYLNIVRLSGWRKVEKTFQSILTVEKVSPPVFCTSTWKWKCHWSLRSTGQNALAKRTQRGVRRQNHAGGHQLEVSKKWIQLASHLGNCYEKRFFTFYRLKSLMLLDCINHQNITAIIMFILLGMWKRVDHLFLGGSGFFFFL